MNSFIFLMYITLSYCNLIHLFVYMWSKVTYWVSNFWSQIWCERTHFQQALCSWYKYLFTIATYPATKSSGKTITETVLCLFSLQKVKGNVNKPLTWIDILIMFIDTRICLQYADNRSPTTDNDSCILAQRISRVLNMKKSWTNWT